MGNNAAGYYFFNFTYKSLLQFNWTKQINMERADV